MRSQALATLMIVFAAAGGALLRIRTMGGTSVDRAEAARLLEGEMVRLEARTYDELAGLVRDVEAYELGGAAGVRYQVEVEAHWVASSGGPIQVLASIDDGSFRGAFSPVTDGFVKHPDTKATSSGRQ